MTSADTGWTNALDHHETVEALAAALPEVARDGFRDVEIPRKDLATVQAEALARAGYVLVPLEGRARLVADLLGQVDEHLADEAATSWFGQPREEQG
jgi:hypothetical protein